MSYISQSAVLLKNNSTQQKGLNTIFTLFIMTKIDSYMENKPWMLLSPVTTIDSYSENKFLMHLPPIDKNYPKIITNNHPSNNNMADVKEGTG